MYVHDEDEIGQSLARWIADGEMAKEQMS